MNITIPYIKSLDPCQDGIDNFEKLYPNYNDSLVNLLSLDDISYSDKMWLIKKVVDIDTLVQWSVECAEFVVDNYNKVHPNDSRVSDCIEMTKKFIAGECGLDELNAIRLEALLALESSELAAWSAAYSAKLSEEFLNSDKSSTSAFLASKSVCLVAWSAVKSAKLASELCVSSVDTVDLVQVVLMVDVAESAVGSSQSAASSAESEKDQEDINLSLLIALLDNEEIK